MALELLQPLAKGRVMANGVLGSLLFMNPIKSGAFGAYEDAQNLKIHDLENNNGDALKFFTWVNDQRPTVINKTHFIEIKACSVARQDEGKKFIIKLSEITGYPVRAWDDWIIAIPFGKEFTAFPDGISRETGDTQKRVSGYMVF